MAQIAVNFIIHNDFEHIYNALKCLYEATELSLDVHIVINAGSTDDTQKLLATYPDIHYHINEQLQGFAANHNQIMRQVESPYVALLNDDISFEVGTLERIITYLNENPDVGIVGPTINFPDGTPHQSAYNDPSLARMIFRSSGLTNLVAHGGIIRKILHQVGISRKMGVASLDLNPRTRNVQNIVGVAMFVRREAYLKAGMMDEFTQVYGEEFGWMLRIRRAGYRIVLLGDAHITHHQTKQQKIQGWKLVEHRKGMLSYFIKYKPQWQATLLRWNIIFFHSLWSLFDRRSSQSHRDTAKMALTWKLPEE